MVSALVLVVGLTASQASFAEFVPPPPVMPAYGYGYGYGGYGYGYGGYGGYGYSGFGYGAYGYGGFDHGGPGFGWGLTPYGRYRHAYRAFMRGFLARGGCGGPWLWRHRGCGFGRRSFRSFSLNIGFGGFGLSINSFRGF